MSFHDLRGIPDPLPVVDGGKYAGKFDGFHYIDKPDPVHWRGTTPDPRWVAMQRGEGIPEGREMDFPQPYPAVEISWTTQRTKPKPGAAKTFYDNERGKMQIQGTERRLISKCAECNKTFTQTRPASQKRKWAKYCSDACQKATRAREARKKRRGQRGNSSRKQ